MTILFAILLFSFLIFIHELGHFAAAKLSGVQVNEFSLFMGPAIWKKQVGETLYALRCIPIGGYCAMEGEDGDSDNPRSFQKAAWWKRLIILVAGAAMNFVAGVGLLGICYAPAEVFVTPVISMVEEGCSLAEGDGIQVTTQNINWVSESMYASALATAGIKDAEVNVACPVKVSGTAALAGIFKAYEATSGELSEVAKDVAAEELVTTGELGDIIGQEQAAQLIALVKQKILELGYNKAENVRPVVIEVAKELNITLTEEQIDTITNLIVTIANMDIDPAALAAQVQKINDSLNGLAETSEKAMSFVESIRDFFNNLVEWFSSLFQ